MSRQRRFNNIIKVTGEQFLFMHNFNSSGGDVWYIWIMLSWNIVVVIHIYTSTPTLLSPPLMLPSSIRRSRVQTRPHPRSCDGVMEWAGLARMWLTLGPVLSLYWEQEQGQEHNNTAQSLLIIGLITAICFGSQTLCQFYFQPNEHSKVFGIMIWKVKTSSHNTLPLYIYYGCIVHNIQYSAWYYWLYIP